MRRSRGSAAPCSSPAVPARTRTTWTTWTRTTFSAAVPDGGDGDGGEESDETKAALDGVLGEGASPSPGARQPGRWSGGGECSRGGAGPGALLHADDAAHAWGAPSSPGSVLGGPCPWPSPAYTTAPATASGEVRSCGQDGDGQVSGSGGSRGEQSVVLRPSLVEPLLSHRVVKVACGLTHTAVLTDRGLVLTYGGNEFGQLGHSFDYGSGSAAADGGASGSGASSSSTTTTTTTMTSRVPPRSVPPCGRRR